ncbi:MAG: polysaccharide deacetylase family protein [Actinomycetota bacterium]
MTAGATPRFWIKKAVKLALLAPASVGRVREPGLYVLIYHRVGAGMGREMDMPEDLFRAQMAYIRRRMEVVTLQTGLDGMRSGSRPGRDQVAVTFDDGYGEVYTHAWPILSSLGVPATVFVSTGFVEGLCSAPIRADALGTGADPEPLTWSQLGEMTASGLDIGSHSHSHPRFDRISREEAAREASMSKEIIESSLGRPVRMFAYPSAVPGNEDAVAENYEYAVARVGSKNLVRGFHPLRVVRTPVRASDGMFFFRRRLEGIRPLEDRLYMTLRGE